MNNDFYDNSLIFIKYLLTIVVIVNHCITHFSLNSPQILFATVPTFFCISGYTVYHSISFKGRNKDLCIFYSQYSIRQGYLKYA